MAKRKKKQQEPEKPKTVKCPLRGHNHDLLLIVSPDRPDLLIAQCSGRDVYQTSANPPRPVEPAYGGYAVRQVDDEPAIVNYVVPNYEDEGA